MLAKRVSKGIKSKATNNQLEKRKSPIGQVEKTAATHRKYQ